MECPSNKRLFSQFFSIFTVCVIDIEISWINQFLNEYFSCCIYFRFVINKNRNSENLPRNIEAFNNNNQLTKQNDSDYQFINDYIWIRADFESKCLGCLSKTDLRTARNDAAHFLQFYFSPMSQKLLGPSHNSRTNITIHKININAAVWSGPSTYILFVLIYCIVWRKKIPNAWNIQCCISVASIKDDDKKENLKKFWQKFSTWLNMNIKLGLIICVYTFWSRYNCAEQCDRATLCHFVTIVENISSKIIWIMISSAIFHPKQHTNLKLKVPAAKDQTKQKSTR